MGPHISAVVSDIDRNVAHDAECHDDGNDLYPLPLPKEFELRKPVKLHLGDNSFCHSFSDSGISLTYSRIPMDPGHVLVDVSCMP